MGQFEFASPGVPIYKANIIPFLENNTPVHCKELDAVTVETWQKMLGKMNGFLQLARDTAYHFINNLPTEERSYRMLELVGDAITAYLRMPLFRDPLMGLAPSPFTIYLVLRASYPDSAEIISRGPVDFLSNVDWGQMDSFHEKVKRFIPEELDVLWFSVPADTRPLYNTSGLIVHLLATSAIAWSLAVSRGRDRTEAAKLRLSAIFHDITKPFDYRRHAELVPEVVKEVLTGVLEDRAVEEIAWYASTHHSRGQSEQSKILADADQYAAASDRLTRLAERIVFPILREQGVQGDLKTGFKWGESAWEFWRTLEQERPGLIRALSNRVAEQLQEPQKGLMDILRQEGEVKIKDLKLILIDVGSIQEFISRAKDLRSVTAASLVVETSTVAHLPLLIQSTIDRKYDCWVPLEAFLIISGGTLTMLLPGRIVEEPWKKRIVNLYGKDRLRIYFAETDYTGNHHRDSENLAKSAYLEKISHEPEENCLRVVTTRGSEPNLCSNCYSEERVNVDGLCRLCSKLSNDLGREVHFRRKWEHGVQLKGSRITPREAFGLDYNTIVAEKKDIMYIIAGHEKPELQPGERKRNIAAIKFDGNLMGMFFANAVSLSDALERSARVDLAMKRSLERALTELYEGVLEASSGIAISQPQRAAERAASSCYLGMVYAGGDDALLLCPSWCAIPMALSVSRYFQEKLGGLRALSVGVAAGPPEHDVWALIDAADRLLKEAKEEGRDKPSIGWIAYDFIEGGILSGVSASSRLKTAVREGLSIQPLALADHKGPSLLKLLEGLGLPLESKGLFSFAYMASREDQEPEAQRELKSIRTELLQSVQVSRTALSGSQMSKIFTLYINRMREEAGGEKGKYYSILWTLLSNASISRDGLRLPILEVSQLVKFLGGGII